MTRMRRMTVAIAMAAMALGTGAAPAGPEVLAGDFNKMVNDGHVVVAAQFPSAMTALCGPVAPCVKVPAGNPGSSFSGYVLTPDGTPAELTTLADGRPLLHVTVFTQDDIGTLKGDHYVTAGGHPEDALLPDVRGTSIGSLSGTRLFTFTLPAVYDGQNTFVTIWAGVVGYPDPCVPVTIGADMCDGGALGFYNPAKATFPSGPLDAVPFPVRLP